MAHVDPSSQTPAAERPKSDALASVVVFLVALPLCLGIAIASGFPPSAGLVTGIVGGIVIGAIGGAPMQVSGPAAGLAVIVFQLVQAHGYPGACVIVVAAGGIQLAAGLMGLGGLFRAVPPAVVHGMLAGIGVLIFASQIHVMVDDKPRKGGLANLLSIPEAIVKGFQGGDLPHQEAAAIGVLTIVLLIAWTKLAPKSMKMIPAPLVAVVGSTGLATVMGWPIARVDLPDSPLSLGMGPGLDMYRMLTDPRVIGASFGMALVASAETLLTAVAVDRMHDGPKALFDRELAAQGLGNMLSGALGGLPMTGVIVRSAANVEAGAQTKKSAIMHGVWLLLFVGLFPWLLEKIPVSALAAVLVYTGYKLVNLTVAKDLANFSRIELAIYAVTLGAIVTTDLLVGVILGFGLALARLVWRMADLQVTCEPGPEPKVLILKLSGSATFLGLPRLADAVDRVPVGHKVYVDTSEVGIIDHACLELLGEWERGYVAKGGEVLLGWDHLKGMHLDKASANGAARAGANGGTASTPPARPGSDPPGRDVAPVPARPDSVPSRANGAASRPG